MQDFIIFFGAGQALILGLGQILRKVNAGNIILSLFFFCVSLLLFISGLMQNFEILNYPFLLAIHLPAILLVGPLLYFYFFSLLSDNFRLNIKYLGHLIPALLAFIALLVFYFLDNRQFFVSLENFISGRGGIVPVGFIITLCSIIAYVLYFVWISTRLAAPEKSTSPGFAYGISVLALVLLLACLGAIARFTIYAIGFINMGAVFVIIGFFLIGQKYPEILHQLKTTVKESYERSLLQNTDLDSIKAELARLMDEEKLFCDEDINLSRLAEALGLSPHQLSQYLNVNLGKNFNSYINEFRIAMARELLVGQTERTTLSIGMSDSNSTFHNAFQKDTGMTPGKYRKAHKGKS